MTDSILRLDGVVRTVQRLVRHAAAPFFPRARAELIGELITDSVDEAYVELAQESRRHMTRIHSSLEATMPRKTAKPASQPIIEHGDSFLDISPRPFTSFDSSRVDVIGLDDVIAAYEQQSTVIEAQKAKTVFAMWQVEALHRQGHLTKQHALNFLMRLDDSNSLSGELLIIFEEARREQLLREIDHLHKLIEVGVYNIAREAHRSLVRDDAFPPASADPARRGVVARFLFGG